MTALTLQVLLQVVATVYRRKDQKYWHCAFYTASGRRAYRSTGKTTRREAKLVAADLEAKARGTEAEQDAMRREILRVLEDASSLALKKRLTVDKGRELLQRMMRAQCRGGRGQKG